MSADPTFVHDVRSAAKRARENLIEALSLLGGGSSPHEEICEALAYLDTVLRELPEPEAPPQPADVFTRTGSRKRK